jgi:hypothetical protein
MNMADTKIIRPIWGEFADQNIELEVADADQAISDGWAFDPHAETPRELPPILTDGQRAYMEECSKKAIAKLRGEDYFEPQSSKRGAKDKALTAEEDSGGTYQTRSGSKSTTAKGK